MTDDMRTGAYSGEEPAPSGRRPRRIWRFLLPAAVVAVGVAGSMVLLRTGPRADRRPPPRTAKLVEVTAVQLGRQQTTIAAMGTVVPAQEVTLMSRVSGQLVDVSPELLPGGRFARGEVVAQVDPADYELLVAQRRSALAQAESALQLELGQQAVAMREYELLGEAVAAEDRDLVLRLPQLQAAKAAVAAARAALEDAELDLQRTRVLAPFNAIVRAKLADAGAQVGVTTPIANLVATDAYWVEALVPVDQLRWMQVPRHSGEPGATARVYDPAAWGPDAWRAGAVVRQYPGLEEKGRMVRLVVAVPDPVARRPDNAGQPRLTLSAYVRVEIQGMPLEQVASLPRGALRDAAQVYLMDDQGQLEIRPVQVVLRQPETVLVRGLRDGERLITTELTAAVAGMAVRVGPGGPGQPQGREEGP